MKKIEILRKEFIPPTFSGDKDPELLLVCWGSTLGAVAETVEDLSSRGIKAAFLHFSQIWPLVAKSFFALLEGSKKVVIVEGNATGQFARLLRREYEFSAHALVSRYDGLPLTPEYISRELVRKGMVEEG